MPTTIKQVIAGVRDYLGNPDYGAVSNASVLLRLYHRLDNRRIEINLTNQNWFLNRAYINVDSTTDEIPLNIGDWGRPINVITIDESDPYHVTREVPIATVQDNDLYYVGSKTSTGTAVFPHVAESFNFFTNNGTGQLTARVTPQHGQSATYQVWYQPDTPTPSVLADNFPLFEAFINLTTVDVALDLLPRLLKEDGTNAAVISFLERRLESAKSEYLATFKAHKNQAYMEQKGTRLGFGEDVEGYWY